MTFFPGSEASRQRVVSREAAEREELTWGVDGDSPWPCQQEKTQVPVPNRSCPAGTSESLPPAALVQNLRLSVTWAQSPGPGSSLQAQVPAHGLDILLQDIS